MEGVFFVVVFFLSYVAEIMRLSSVYAVNVVCLCTEAVIMCLVGGSLESDGEAWLKFALTLEQVGLCFCSVTLWPLKCENKRSIIAK